jgi:hypothetical protein
VSPTEAERKDPIEETMLIVPMVLLGHFSEFIFQNSGWEDVRIA